MTEQVLREIKREKLIEKGDMILIGLSGGADSVCLLLILQKLREKIGFDMEAVHVEHGIRGAESLADADFVKELCANRGIFCRVFLEDVPQFAQKAGIGLEEAARIRRYACYKMAADEAKERFGERNIKIALAHHADDNAETILFQMARGSGLDGLCGMPYAREWNGLQMIRPLLGQSREQIEVFLEKCGQAYCIDGTNTDLDYSRNRIRHRVLPELKKVNGQAVRHINQSACLLREMRAYLKDTVDKAYRETVRKSGGTVRIGEGLWKDYPKLIRTEVIHNAVETAARSKKDITSAHVEAVQELYALQVGRQIALPYGITAERSYGQIILKKKADTVRTEEKIFLAVDKERLDGLFCGKTLEIALPAGRILMSGFDFDGEIDKIPKKAYTKWLNYDKIKCGLQIRTKAPGDFLTVDQEGHTKKLKEYLINEKVPREKRDKLYLLADGAHIMWVAGGRMSAGYKVDENTKRVLEVQFFGGEYDESQEY